MLMWLLENTLLAGLLALGVSLACRVRRLSPAVRNALWLVVVIRLVAPPIVSWPWSLPQAFGSPLAHLNQWTSSILQPAWRGVAISDQTTGNEDSADLSPERLDALRAIDGMNLVWPMYDVLPVGGLLVPLEAAPLPAVVPSLPAVETDRNRQWKWLGECALGAWLLGLLVTALIHAARVAQFRKMLRRGVLARGSVVGRVHVVAQMLGVRPPVVSLVESIRSPVIWGGLRTRLVWPRHLAGDFESGHWDGVIAHELAHLSRGDHWVGWLELLGTCVYWWNPLFWYVRHQLRESAEQACDALVVCVLPNGRHAYATSLIEIVSQFSHVTAPLPVFGVHSTARQALERRLVMILCERVSGKLSMGALMAITVLALAALPGWSQAQSPAADRPVASPVVPRFDAVTAPVVATPLEALSVPAEPAVAVDAQGVSADYFVLKQAGSDDARVEALEKKLEALIQEVRAMRAGRSDAPRALAVPKPATSVLAPVTTAAAAAGANSNVQTLTRATYALPKAKADAMAAFLREHMKSPIESRVDGDQLIVTASPEAQATIGHFIALSEGTTPTTQWPYGVRYTPAANSQSLFYRVPVKVKSDSTPDPKQP
jgi:beta-lactamase regulating signal transducer with metallopeptidase domain